MRSAQGGSSRSVIFFFFNLMLRMRLALNFYHMFSLLCGQVYSLLNENYNNSESTASCTKLNLQMQTTYMPTLRKI